MSKAVEILKPAKDEEALIVAKKKLRSETKNEARKSLFCIRSKARLTCKCYDKGNEYSDQTIFGTRDIFNKYNEKENL